MIWLSISVIAAAAVALYLARRQVAEVQALVVGGRIGGAGCVVVQAAALFAIALLLFIFRDYVR